jgi:hypothetical protein
MRIERVERDRLDGAFDKVPDDDELIPLPDR